MMVLSERRKGEESNVRIDERSIGSLRIAEDRHLELVRGLLKEGQMIKDGGIRFKWRELPATTSNRKMDARQY